MVGSGGDARLEIYFYFIRICAYFTGLARKYGPGD
jgi:hypothetical protein